MCKKSIVFTYNCSKLFLPTHEQWPACLYQWVRQSVSQSVSQLVSQSVSVSVIQWVSQSVSQSVSDKRSWGMLVFRPKQNLFQPDVSSLDVLDWLRGFKSIITELNIMGNKLSQPNLLSLLIKSVCGNDYEIFTENLIRIKNYQEALKYMEKLKKEIQHSIDIKLETWLKATAKTELIEQLEMNKWNNSKEHLQIENKFKLNQFKSTANNYLETKCD